MTATILRMCDHEPSLAFSKMEAGLNDALVLARREAEIGRLGLPIVAEALNFPTDRELFEIEASDQIEEYTAPDEDCA